MLPALARSAALTAGRRSLTSSEAISQHASALAVKRQLLGDLHPATIQRIHTLATALSKAGQEKEAKTLYAEAALYKRQLYSGAVPI